MSKILRKSVLFSLAVVSIVGSVLSPVLYAYDSSVSYQVNGVVLPKPTDFQASLASLTSGSQFHQDQTITYQLTYGSSISYADTITLEATWSRGTIQNAPTPSVDILEYVSGSATKAYNNTSPVIDTVKRKITWTIRSFPANTSNQTVTFSLKTKNMYNGLLPITFSVTGRVINGTIQSTDSTVTQRYLYDSTITPIPLPTATPTPAQPEPTPQKPALPPLRFTSIDVTTLSQSEATIAIMTSRKAKLAIQYGSSPNNLPQKIIATIPETEHEILLDKLQPATNYYFQVVATDPQGNTTTSDIYTFSTAIISEKPSINKQTLVVTSSHNIILNSALAISPIVIIPTDTVYEFQFALAKNQSAQRIQAVVRNALVLGASTENASDDPNAVQTEMVETQPGIYVGKLKSIPTAGLYNIFARIYDNNGNIVEEKIAALKVINPLTILDRATKQPIEHARIFLSFYNVKTRLYEPISPQLLPLINPAFSDRTGQVRLVLPPGQYQAVISHPLYQNQTVTFTIGPGESETFPAIYLGKGPFVLLTIGSYYGGAALDILSSVKTFIQSLSNSYRFFDLFSFLSVLTLVLLTLLAFSYRIHIPLTSLHWYILSHLKEFFTRHDNKEFIQGKVLEDGKDSLIVGAHIFLIDGVKNKILAKATTNHIGEFVCKKPSAKSYKIIVVKRGFESTPLLPYSKESLEAGGEIIISMKQKAPRFYLFEQINSILRGLLNFSFEILLFLSVLFEAFFGYSLGWDKTIPFFIVSMLNFLLWLIFLQHTD